MRYFDEWMSKFRPSISIYDYYIDFAKVIKNIDEIKVELNILNSLIGSKNIENEFGKNYNQVSRNIKMHSIIACSSWK
ncbi:DpnII family type II restriction endonuclease [Anaerovibrio lipolyticus]|uniref:DpnII family type II restriction endonuclease n=1 Tax=Anaerovibrio lipolyticus TaxID=82374 RepID=UPI002285FBA4|nr:DpnII family type II restriction endonuclease [Anaerovibrio lipolyticus]